MTGKYLEENCLTVAREGAEIIADILLENNSSPRDKTGFCKSPAETKAFLRRMKRKK